MKKRTTKTAKQILKRVRAIIDNGWCRGVSNRTIDGQAHYCLNGAVGHMYRKMMTIPSFPFDYQSQLVYQRQSKEFDSVREAIMLEARKLGFLGMMQFNDRQKDKRPVLAFLDRVLKTL